MAGLLDTLKEKAKQVYSQGLLSQITNDPASIGNELSQLFDPNYMRNINPMTQEAAFDVALSAPMMAGTIKNVGKTAFEDAFDVAQRNAALPISKGGLGLPATNTAMDRAKALGFDTPAYHGTEANILKFSAKKSKRGKGVSLAEIPENANLYSRDVAIYPVLTRSENILDVTNPIQLNKLSAAADKYLQSIKPYDNKMTFYPFTKENVFEKLKDKNSAFYAEMPLTEQLTSKLGYSGTKALENNMPQYKVYNPKDIRSVNAAFDPFRRNEADILAGAVAAPIGLLNVDKEKKKKK